MPVVDGGAPQGDCRGARGMSRGLWVFDWVSGPELDKIRWNRWLTCRRGFGLSMRELYKGYRDSKELGAEGRGPDSFGPLWELFH